MSTFHFWKSCPEMVGDEVAALGRMISGGKSVSHTTFRKVVGREVLDQWAAAHLYDVGPGRHGGLRLSKDWHVAFYRSTWEGKPCLFLVWSAMEIVFRSDVPARDPAQPSPNRSARWTPLDQLFVTPASK